MSDKKKKEQDQNQKKRAEWNDKAKDIWLAGLGALSAVEQEGGKLFRNLVDRGSEFENKRKEQLEDMWQDVSDRYKSAENQVGEKFDKVEEAVESSVKSVVSRMGIPSRTEVEELSRKVDALKEKLEKIEEKQKSSGTSKTGKSKKGSEGSTS